MRRYRYVRGFALRTPAKPAASSDKFSVSSHVSAVRFSSGLDFRLRYADCRTGGNAVRTATPSRSKPDRFFFTATYSFLRTLKQNFRNRGANRNDPPQFFPNPARRSLIFAAFTSNFWFIYSHKCSTYVHKWRVYVHF